MSEQVIVVSCPRCKDEHEDDDGFGVLYCDKCGFCQHASLTGGVCDFCGHGADIKES